MVKYALLAGAADCSWVEINKELTAMSGSNSMQTPKEEIDYLVDQLTQLQREYYVLGQPSSSDLEYDRLFNRLQELEQEYPHLQRPDSPTLRVGSDLTSELPEVEHTVPVLSLDKAYSAEEVLSWMERLRRRTEGVVHFTAEEKIDGVSLVLYYEQGVLSRAVTRGNGFVGNDVTANARTIKTLPLRLTQAVDIAVRGEVFLPKAAFSELNEIMEPKFANPRNLAAGTLRRIKSRDTAGIPLDIFVYEGYVNSNVPSPPDTNTDMLVFLRELGLPVNNRWEAFTSQQQLRAYINREERERQQLPYEIDGLVVKVDELDVRELLGYTGHHPRWAIAYKFEAPQAESAVHAIDVQVGRTGRITPVARINPVRVGGSVVSNVTLHNQDYIDMLELSIGDTVAVSKRGDVIPAVEKVTDKNPEGRPVWKMPSACPSCGTQLRVTGAHHFCPNYYCPDQVYGRILFFAGRGQMDIDGLGKRTVKLLIDKNMVSDIADLYFVDYDQLLGEEGFGQKKVEQLKKSIKSSRRQPFEVVLRSLGVPELGKAAAELLIHNGIRSIDQLTAQAATGDLQQLLAIDGFGPKTAETIVREFTDPRRLKTIERLKEAGLSLTAEEAKQSEQPEQTFSGQIWCVTGSFEHFKPRTIAEEEITARGGRITSSVTGKTTHLLVGDNPGSKLKKAQELGIKVIDEQEFLRLLS
ncbi:MAG: NAD-dependent DNA ligase LigA [Spirochaetota bacterium]